METSEVDSLVKKFLEEKKPILISLAQSHLQGNVSRDELLELTSTIIDDWANLSDQAKSEPYSKGEETFWATIWEIENFCCEDGLPDEDMQKLLELLKHDSDLPKGSKARRP
jgi:hypothetical protein